MWGVVILLAGMAIGSVCTLLVVLAGRPPALPPATARQVRRDRARRLDIGTALARPAPTDHDRRNWLPPSVDEFDREETH
jgi:hypothetical protein